MMQVSVGYFFRKKKDWLLLGSTSPGCNHVKWVRLDGISKAKHPGGDEDSHPGARMAWPWSPQNDPIVDPMAHPHVTVTWTWRPWARLYANTLQGWYFGEDLFEETWRNKHHFNSSRGCCGIASKGTCIQVILTSNLSIIPNFENYTLQLCLAVAVAPWKDLSTQPSYARNAILHWCSWSSRKWHRHACRPSDTQRSKTASSPPTFQLVRQSSVIVQRQCMLKKQQIQQVTVHLMMMMMMMMVKLFEAEVQQHATIWQWCSNTFPQISTNSHIYKLSPSKSPTTKKLWDCHGWNFFGLMVSLTHSLGFPNYQYEVSKVEVHPFFAIRHQKQPALVFGEAEAAGRNGTLPKNAARFLLGKGWSFRNYDGISTQLMASILWFQFSTPIL